ncbi:glycosyl hydrolase family 65 protein [Pedobacter steynii]
MRVRDGRLKFCPFLPKQWDAFSFTIGFRGIQLKIRITAEQIIIINNSDQLLEIFIFNESYSIPKGEKVISYNKTSNTVIS